MSHPTGAGLQRQQVDLCHLLVSDPPPFALLHRPQSAGRDRVGILVGDISTVNTVAELPLPAPTDTAEPGPELLAVLPYRQIAERGYTCHDDGAPLLVMTVREHGQVSVADALRRIPDLPLDLVDGDFDIDDESYADIVRKVLTEEIGRGEGANFVIKRSYLAHLPGAAPRRALAIFRQLLRRERGAYWTFVVHTGTRTFVGATPERHISLLEGTVMMNPISGTYRYPGSGPTRPGVLRFLGDRKEADELYMVVDEELKMMARVCDRGGQVVGPYLKEMAKLAHTEYLLRGQSSRDVRDILRESMFAPTVTGSPLANACRVIARYEPGGRGYYGGALALIGRDLLGQRTLDASILIRTAEIDTTGQLRLGVGATLVRHSDPDSEAAETRAKAAGLLAAINGPDTVSDAIPASGSSVPDRLGAHPVVRAALAARNTVLAGFWLHHETSRLRPDPKLTGRRVLVIDAEDTFTAMLGHQLRSFGLTVTIRHVDELGEPSDFDMVVVGPGPGDPREVNHPKIASLRRITQGLLRDRIPFLSVCLGHQVLSGVLGFELIRKEVPNQGFQREIELFGQRVRVGFYNTFAARSVTDDVECAALGVTVQVCRDADSGEVHALRGPGFRSLQFHPESVLSPDGMVITSSLLTALLADTEPASRLAVAATSTHRS